MFANQPWFSQQVPAIDATPALKKIKQSKHNFNLLVGELGGQRTKVSFSCVFFSKNLLPNWILPLPATVEKIHNTTGGDCYWEREHAKLYHLLVPLQHSQTTYGCEFVNKHTLVPSLLTTLPSTITTITISSQPSGFNNSPSPKHPQKRRHLSFSNRKVFIRRVASDFWRETNEWKSDWFILGV